MSSVCVCVFGGNTRDEIIKAFSKMMFLYLLPSWENQRVFFPTKNATSPRSSKVNHPSVISSFGHGRTLAWSSPSPKVPKLSKLTTFCLEETGASYSWDKIFKFLLGQSCKTFHPPTEKRTWDLGLFGKKTEKQHYQPYRFIPLQYDLAIRTEKRFTQIS